MTLSVASRGIDRPQKVSEQARFVLGLVDGGMEWLSWAIQDSRARYHFEDENALVAGIQSGLHASRLVVLPRLGLIVSPVKLMTLSPAELHMLQVANEPSGATAAARAKAVLLEHQLVLTSELAGAAAFRKELDVADAPLFRCMTLGEELAMLDLSLDPDDGDPSDAPQREAAQFALEQSRTSLEFVDYYRVYRRLAAFVKPPRSRDRRKEHAEAALGALLPTLFHALDCPRVDGLPAPWEVSAAIEEWLMMGRRLGFARLSQGVEQVIAHAGFVGNEDEEAERIVGAYLAEAQELLRSAELGTGWIGQDGTCTFSIRSGTHEARVASRPNGIITLSSYRRLLEKPAESSTPSKRKHHGKA